MSDRSEPTSPYAPRSSSSARGSAGSVSEDTAIRPTDQGGSTTVNAPVIPPAAPAKPQKGSRSGRSGSSSSASSNGRSSNGVAARDDGTTTASRPKATRRARLRLTRVDPWSVMKTAFLLSIAFGVVTIVSVAMVWQVLGAAGVWDSINSTIQETIGGPDTSGFDVQDYVGTSRVLGFTMLVAAVDVVLLTAVATLGAFLYNMAAALLGGIEITLAEDPH